MTDKTPENKTPENKTPENKTPADQTPPDKNGPEVSTPAKPEPELPIPGKPESLTSPAPGAKTEDTDAERAQVEKSQAVGGQTEVLATRKGMFGVRGSGDTSGYGGLTKIIEFPPGSEPPYGGYYDQVNDRIGELLPSYSDVITKVVMHRGEITFHVAREHLLALVEQLRNDAHLRFEFCSSVSGVNFPTDTGGELHVMYHLQSMTYNRRIRLEVSCPDADPHIPSVTPLYPTADWQERETYDMFGVVFDGHPALTRILMPDDWPGFPQRKDYPLGGIEVEYKGATIAPPDQRRSYN